MSFLTDLGSDLSELVRDLSSSENFGASVTVYRAYTAREAGERSHHSYAKDAQLVGVSAFLQVIAIQARVRMFGDRSKAVAIVRIAQQADGTMPQLLEFDGVLVHDGAYAGQTFICEQNSSTDPAALFCLVPLVNAPKTAEFPS